VKVRLLLPDPSALEAGQILIDNEVYRIVAEEWHDERNVNLRLAGVRSRNAAHALKGKQVSVDPGWFTEDMGRPLASYLGMRVINDDTDQFIAKVTEVAHNGAQVILVVSEGEDERMIPLVDEFVVVTTSDEIRVRPIPGLLSDDNES